MGILAKIPEPVRKTLAAVAPAGLVDALRRAMRRDFDPSISVARESAASRFFWRHIMHRYLPSMVSRQSRLARWYSSTIALKRISSRTDSAAATGQFSCTVASS